MLARWKVTLQGAKDEALLAVNLYNQPLRPRRFEGFFVDMHLAWLYLFQALYQRDRLGYFYRLSNGRYEKIDGERKTWALAAFTKARWPEHEPIRRNLEVTIVLRNKIEHRYEDAIAVATAGFAQALLLNFEAELTSQFSFDESLGGSLRFPVFVGAFTREGAARMAAVQASVPAKTRKFLSDFQGDLSPGLAEDPRYEFRINLLPKLGPKTEADLSLTFVRADDLTDEKRAARHRWKGRHCHRREQVRDVANADKMKPGETGRRIQAKVPWKFSVLRIDGIRCDSGGSPG